MSRFGGMQVWVMPQGAIIDMTAANCARLKSIVADRSRKKDVWRAAIVLTKAFELGKNEVARRNAMSTAAVWPCKRRFDENA